MVLKGLKKRHNEGKYFNTYRSSNLVIQNIGLYSTEKENNRIRKKFKYKSTLRYAFQRKQSAPTRKKSEKSPNCIIKYCIIKFVQQISK